MPDQNWVALSQASLAPIVAGRFIVHGSHDRHRFALRRRAIEIDAGEAFGTGYNATTTLCLEALDTLARRRRFCARARSRLRHRHSGDRRRPRPALGAGARRRQRSRCHGRGAFERPPQPPRAARAGDRRCGFRHPLLRRPRAFDLVLANILAATLIDLAPAMRRAVRRGGIAILSGLLTHQAREVSAVYRAAGFQLCDRRQRDDWVALTLCCADS